ncbi:hypothetical protein CEXT_569051, partial [Caerostris extrusa]
MQPEDQLASGRPKKATLTFSTTGLYSSANTGLYNIQ